jgi:S-layer homology domain/Carboxypeptidase regulatory-like domain
MSKLWIGTLAFIGALSLIFAVGSVAMTSSAYAGKQSEIAGYVVTSGPQVWSRYGLTPDYSSGLPSTNPLRMPPLLLSLARDGHVQNMRMSPDGGVTLLADSSAAQLLRDGGSVLSRSSQSGSKSQSVLGALSGAVTASGGGAMAGATVSAFLGNSVVTTTTSVSGTYALSLPGTGDYQVGVYAAGYEWQPAVLVAMPTGATDVNFALVPQNFTISGTIRTQGSGNQPIANIQVWASDLAYDNFTKGDSTTTDVNGNYTLRVSASTYEVRVFNPPLGAKSSTVTVGPSATGKDFRFSLQTLYTVSGIVRKGEGQPLPGGEVTLSKLGNSFNSCDASYVAVATAAANGSYSIRVPAGDYAVYANWSNEFGDHWVIDTNTQLTVSSNVSNYNLTLPRVGTIRGTVFDTNGQPLANATVFSWRVDNREEHWFDGFFQTAADGSYVVTATLGTHSLLAFSNEFANSAVQTVVLTGASTGINMQVTAGIQAGGLLTGSDAKPLGWATIRYLTGAAGSQFNRAGIVYYNGRWRTVTSAGSYTVNAAQSMYVEAARSVSIAPNPPDINFTLTKKTQRLVGKATIPGGSGLCDTYMNATNTATGQAAYGNSTGDGNYAMMVAPGTYNVWPYKYSSNSSSFNTVVTVPPVPSQINFMVTEIMFHDVMSDTYYFEPVGFMVYNGYASGYSDGTFRPNNPATRGQVAKMVVLSSNWTLVDPPNPTFSDVPAGSTFYTYVETAVAHGIINGYSDGTFRPNANVTRSQLTKIVVLAHSWTLSNPPSPTFSDVPAGSTFYTYVETAVAHQILSGYQDGTFRPANNATRGQISKILYGAITQP